MRQYVFLVHGMGKHASGSWADSWIRVLLDTLRQYGQFKALSDQDIQKDHLHFVPVSYDTVFEDDYRKAWGSLAGAVADMTQLGQLRGAFEWLETASPSQDEADVFWTHVLDPLLWFGFIQARQRVIALVAKQLAAGLQKMQAESAGAQGQAGAHIIAHSLGTSVIHDTLVSLSDNQLTGQAFGGQNLKWQTVVMVSNVSRLLAAWQPVSDSIPLDQYRPHSSKVQPGVSGSLVQKFINLRHEIDPFTFPRRFKPDWSHGGYKSFLLDRFDDVGQVHDFETYLAHPAAHVEILRSITGIRTLGTRSERDAAWRAYDQRFGHTATGQLADLQQLLAPSADRKLGITELAKYLLKAFSKLRGL